MSQDLVNKKMNESVIAALEEAKKRGEKIEKSLETALNGVLTRPVDRDTDDETSVLYVLTKNVEKTKKLLDKLGVSMVKSERENSVESTVTVREK